MPQRSWTDENDNRLRAMAKAGKSHKEMARVLGVRVSQVSGRCHRIGIRMDRTRWDRRNDALVLSLFKSGLSFAEIGARFGKSSDAIGYHLNRLGCQRHPRVPPEKIAEVRRHLSTSPHWSDREIARRVGTSEKTVARQRREKGIPSLDHQKALLRSRVGKIGSSPVAQKYLKALSDGPLTRTKLSQRVGTHRNTAWATLYVMRKSGLVFAESGRCHGVRGHLWHSLGWWLVKNEALLVWKAREVWRANRHVEFDDVLSQLRIEVATCVRPFRPVGIKFSTYAVRWAVQSLKAWCARQLGRGIHFPQQVRTLEIRNRSRFSEKEGVCELQLDREHDDHVLPDPKSFWDDVTEGLDPRLARVLVARFREEKTLQEIGEELGITRERVRQLELKALEERRTAMERYVG